MTVYGLCFIVEQEEKPIPLQNVVAEANSKFVLIISLYLVLIMDIQWYSINL